MIIDQTAITQALIGGSIIAVSSSSFLRYNTRVAGCSGILGNCLNPNSSFRHFESVMFLLGLILVPVIFKYAFGTSGMFMGREVVFFDDFDATGVRLRPWILVIAGILTGVGAIKGTGCTSGHGIFGLALLRTRALAAVLSFMAAGMVVSSVMYSPKILSSGILLVKYNMSSEVETFVDYTMTALFFLIVLYAGAFLFLQGSELATDKKNLLRTSFYAGTTFGTGLLISGMCRPSKVTGFLNIYNMELWDPSLAAVMGGGVVVNYFLLQRAVRYNTEASKMLACMTSKIDLNLVAFSAMFGAGWGLAGACPGPAVINTFTDVSGLILSVGLILAFLIAPAIPNLS